LSGRFIVNYFLIAYPFGRYFPGNAVADLMSCGY
jgi:hypothetical protein